MDLAIGMIIGAAFTALVNSVVSNLFMPIISLFTGGIDFSNLYLPLNAASKDAFMAGADINTARAVGSVLPYGTFITDLIQFLILAFVVFLMVRALAKMMKVRKKKRQLKHLQLKNVHSVKQKFTLMQLNVLTVQQI